MGCERLALASLDALGLPGVLKDVGLSDCDARIAMALVIARMIHPSSEREALRWFETNSATLELPRLDTGQALKLDKLYRLSDLLVKHHRAIEDALFARQRKLFGKSGAVIFHDLTNTHMTGRPASELVRFGRSRQQRNDCPLVTLALATSGNEARVWKLSHDHENEAQLCIWSQARQEKDEAIPAKKRERLKPILLSCTMG